MKYQLSFGYFILHEGNVAEVVANDGIEMTLEMIEECHAFIDQHISGGFGLLVNSINKYTYSYEARLSIASYENMVAIAFVYYNIEAKQNFIDLQKTRSIDDWSYRLFSGLELGWQQAYEWLVSEVDVPFT